MDSAVSLRLPEDLKSRLDKLSKLTGRSKTYYMVEAISEKLADLEDIYLAEQRTLALRAGASKTYSLDEVEQRLGQPHQVPAGIIPASEMWLYENPEALASVKLGLQESSEGKSHDRGSFAVRALG